MTSILTNTAAMGALQALTTTQRALATAQAQVSSGAAVATAADGAALWSVSRAMRGGFPCLARRCLGLPPAPVDVVLASDRGERVIDVRI